MVDLWDTPSHIELDFPGSDLLPAYIVLLKLLHRHFHRVMVKFLSRDFDGTLTCLAIAVSAKGYAERPLLVRLMPALSMKQEVSSRCTV